MSNKLTDIRTAQTVAVAAVVRAVGATGAFIYQPISMEFKYVLY